VKILLDIGHPAHVHQFKNAIKILETSGHEILVTARNKEVTLYLLDRFGIKYVEVGQYKQSNISKAIEMFRIDYRLYKLAKTFNPDVLVGGVGNVYVAHVSALINKPAILFNDTEHAVLQNLLSYPFASAICTPSCYNKDLGKKQIRYNGYHELAYLHPNYFTPNPAVLDEIGLSEGDTFIILRFVSWTASHDIGHHGIQDKTTLVRELEKYGQVFITSEGRLDGGLAKYQIKVAPEKMHDLMYYATLLYGESATMASECAVLGTHAIYCDFAGRGYTDEEESKYGLVCNFKSDEDSIRSSREKAVELLGNNNLKSIGRKKGAKLLGDKIDVTAFMIWFIENYPGSFVEMKESDGEGDV
jgi:predicted glycosyltransferase